MGWLARWTRRRTGTLPSFVGAALLGIGTAGVTLMPRSGFWAVFVAAILAFGERDTNRKVSTWEKSTTA